MALSNHLPDRTRVALTCLFINHIPLGLLTSLLICFTSFGVIAQNLKRVDSLKNRLRIDNANRAAILYELAYEYSDEQDSVSLVYAQQSLEAAYKTGDSLQIVKAARITAGQFRRLEMFGAAIDYANQALNIARRHNYVNEIKLLTNSLAISHTLRSQYDKALGYHFESLAIREAEGNKLEVSVSLQNIAFVYYKLNDSNNALEYYLRSQKLKNEIHDTSNLDRLFINIGLCYNFLTKYKEAEEYFIKALNVCHNHCSDQILIEGKLGLGLINENLKKSEVATKFFRESLSLAKKISNRRFQAENLNLLARINFEKSNLDSALVQWKETEQLSVAYGYNFLLVNAYRGLSELYNKQKDFEKASLYQSKYINLNDSLFGQKQIMDLASTEANLKERENLAIISLQKKALTTQRYLNFAIGVIGVLTVSLLFGLYRRNRLLKQKSEILAEQNREKTGMINIVAHDLKSPLNKIKGLMSLIKMTGKFSDEQQEYVSYIDKSLQEGDHLIRDLLDVHAFEHEDSKVELEEFVVKKMLCEWQQTATGHLSQKGQTLHSQIELTEGQLMATDKFKLTRILDNLLTNASKFSPKERNIYLKVWQIDHSINFSIRDEGPGISDDDKKKMFKRFQKLTAKPTAGEGSSGLGLSIIKVLVERLGGSITVNSKLGEGAEFVVSLPEKVSAH